jgi:hypothetical protein
MDRYGYLFPYVQIIIQMLLWLIVFLVVVLLIMLLIRWLRGPNFGGAVIEETGSGLFDRKKRVTRTRAASGFAEKLGEKIVGWLVDIAKTNDRTLLNDRLNRIRNECNRLSVLATLPKENKQIVSTVMLWAKKFNIERHLNDMRLLKYSTQIIYDPVNRDFKLKVSGD